MHVAKNINNQHIFTSSYIFFTVLRVIYTPYISTSYRIPDAFFVNSMLHDISPKNTPPGDPNGGVVYFRVDLSPEKASRICLCFWKETIPEK
jgi:hypothetical protein